MKVDRISKFGPSNPQKRYIDLTNFGPQIRKIADTKHQELPGSSATFMIIDFAISYHQSAIKPSSSWLLPFQVGCATWKFIMIPKMLSASTVHCSPQLVICKGWANPRGSRVRVSRVRVRVRIL